MQSQALNISVLRYYAYATLVGVKRTVGLNPNRHRNYLIWKLVKLLDSGRINRDRLSITSKGKTDGAGAQALAKISAMCLAKAYGLTYVHTPFQKLAHAETDPQRWAESWEQLLNMGSGHPLLQDIPHKVVELGDYVSNPSLWQKNVILADRHFHPFCELAPHYGSQVAKDLRPAFPDDGTSHCTKPQFAIGVHVRRGDVSAKDRETKHRYTKSSHTISVLQQVVQAARDAGHDPLIRLHSNGSKEELSEFSAFPGIEYRVGQSAVEDFSSLAKSDILITTRSDFSVLAAYYCKGLVVCDPRHRTPLPEWIKCLGREADLAAEVFPRLQKSEALPERSAHALKD